MNLTYDEPIGVRITQGRWEVSIEVVKEDGTVEKFIASADSALTGRSGIWFGTPEEMKAELNP